MVLSGITSIKASKLCINKQDGRRGERTCTLVQKNMGYILSDYSFKGKEATPI